MFDPYEKWLRIPKDQRPIDYFLLLDVDPEEADPEVIRKAAARQTARVRAHEEGPHAQECDRLLNEIEQGRDTLLKPAKRKAYEEKLRKNGSDKARRAEETEEDDPPRRAPGKNKRPGKPSRKSSKPEESGRTWLWIALGGAAACLLVGGGVTAFLLMRPKKTDVPVSSGPVASAPEQPVTPPPAPKQEKDPPPKQEPPKEPVKQPPPPPPVVKAPPPPLSRPAAAKLPAKIVKIPVPDSSAQQKAEKALKDTYRADYAKTKPEDNLALAAKLLQPGRENRADPAAWFVLLREARDAAVRAGRSRLAVEAVNEMDKWFIMDGLAMKLDVLARVSETPDGARAATKTALAQVEPALDADDYPAALRLVDAAEAAARKTSKVDDKQLAQIATRRGQVQGFQKLYELIPAAREKLRVAPADADASLLVGKHLCLFQGRWDEGLPMLAKAGKTEEAGIARQDLTPPADVKAQVSVGDGWWRVGQGFTGRQKWHLQERALAWYELAAPKVVGEDRVRLTERIVEGIKASAARIPRLMPGSFLGRDDIEDRTLLLREGGGSMRSEEAVEKGLAWLSQHQSPSGKWATDAFHKVQQKCNCTEPGQKFDVGGTAFGLLPFLGAGQTHRHGRYKNTVQRGLAFLRTQQKPEGKFSDNAYENALATIAVCEAYGQTKDKSLVTRAQLAVNFIVRAQHSEGSWGYSPGTKGDTSVSGWQFSALKAAHFAGLSVPASTFVGMSAFLDQVADPNDLGYGYNTRGAGRATSATGLLCREFLGWGPRHPIQARGIKQLLEPANFVTKDRPSIYFLFYATQAMHHAGGDEWESWNSRARELLIELQDQGKEKGKEHQKGSWSPRGDEYAAQGGRLMFTSLALLALEVYYYHIPLNGFGPAVLQE